MIRRLPRARSTPLIVEVATCDNDFMRKVCLTCELFGSQ